MIHQFYEMEITPSGARISSIKLLIQAWIGIDFKNFTRLYCKVIKLKTNHAYPINFETFMK
jgi:hypothetical protein